ncbi:missing-in-metastasis isoform X2 [Tachypleus tridentatus]|uniref:missing-in-metastasis isoform X2 n=1 Tax=Tachypleus tridentatus TaxID=6853 RepID=UPI003FD10220
METTVEKDCSALGGLFQFIITDLKGGTQVWEDFIGKALKLHSQLRNTIIASSVFLDSFQRVADMATGTKGATRDIGTALTRLCLRHRSVEARLKTFTSALMDCLVIPLQNKLEEWKKTATQLDKEHTKEYKRSRQEIKKKSTDTLRLQKKARKVSGKCEVQQTIDSALQDVNDKCLLLEETEKQAVRRAMIEERSRYCLFISYLKPVVEEELCMIQEITHVQEVLETLLKNSSDPYNLPQASEQVINDVKGSGGTWSFQTPPSSPSSIGSRKSSMCSISSLNSSSSGSTKSHSPSHHFRHRSLSQVCGFTDISSSSSSTSSTPPSPYTSVTATWPSQQDTHQVGHSTLPLMKSHRPHTISSAYERAGRVRPTLTVHTFKPLGQEQFFSSAIDSTVTSVSTSNSGLTHLPAENEVYTEQLPQSPKPPVPKRGKSFTDKTPSIPEKSLSVKNKCTSMSTSPGVCAGVEHDTRASSPPTYVNTSELASLATARSSDGPKKKELAAMIARSFNELKEQHRPPTSTGHYRRQSDTTNVMSSFVDSKTSEGSPRFKGLSAECSSHTSSLRRSSCKTSSKPPPPVRRSSTLSTPTHRKSSLGTGKSFSFSSPISSPKSIRQQIFSKEKVTKSSFIKISGMTEGVTSPEEDFNTSRARLIQTLNAKLSQQQQVFKEPQSKTDFGNSYGKTSDAHLEELTFALEQQKVSDSPLHRKNSAENTVLSKTSVCKNNTSETKSHNLSSSKDVVFHTSSHSLDSTDHTESSDKHGITLAQKETLVQNFSVALANKQINSRHSLSSDNSFTSIDHDVFQFDVLPQQHSSNEPASESENPLKQDFIEALNAKLAQKQKSDKRGSSQGQVHSKGLETDLPLHAARSEKIQQQKSEKQDSIQEHVLIDNLSTAHDVRSEIIHLQKSEKQGSVQGHVLTDNLSPLHVVRSNVFKEHKSRRQSSLQAHVQHKTVEVTQPHHAVMSDLVLQGKGERKGSLQGLVHHENTEDHSLCRVIRAGTDMQKRESTRSFGAGHPSQTEAAARVHYWLSKRGSIDLNTCRESLMNQIRQGTALKKVPTNDRSAPRFS